RFERIDTLFGLPEAAMDTTMVDWSDPQSGSADYDQLFGDNRAAIDEAHHDDTHKHVLQRELAALIGQEPLLGERLHKFLSAGKKLLRLTNSLWDDRNAGMSSLLAGERKASPPWRNSFDIVVAGGAKRAFFTELRPFVQIDPVSGEPVATNGEIK